MGGSFALCQPKSKIGYGAYFVLQRFTEYGTSKSPEIHSKRFEQTSSTKAELQTFLWALESVENISKDITVYTDCQNIIGLRARRERLEARNYYSKKGRLLRDYELYQAFFQRLDDMNITIIKVKGHRPSQSQNQIERLFSLVDKESRRVLRTAIQK